MAHGKMEKTYACSNPLIAIGVIASTATTDAVYVLFSSAVSARRRISAANWSSLWYMLSPSIYASAGVAERLDAIRFRRTRYILSIGLSRVNTPLLFIRRGSQEAKRVYEEDCL
jgi:hypothetical protein